MEHVVSRASSSKNSYNSLPANPPNKNVESSPLNGPVFSRKEVHAGFEEGEDSSPNFYVQGLELGKKIEEKLEGGKNRLLWDKPRLSLLEAQQIPPSEIKQHYLKWLMYDEYVCLKREDDRGNVKYLFLKCRKRGNNVYVRWVKKKLGDLKLLDCRAVFLTLTCDPKVWKGVPVYDVWRIYSKLFNRFMSFLKKRYGEAYLGFFRVWEAFRKPPHYPHIHVIIFLKYLKYVPKSELIKEWGAWVKINLVRNTPGAISYLLKYLLKSLENADLSIQICWLLRLRSFGVSRALIDLIQAKHNSNQLQRDLMGNFRVVYVYEFLGIVWLGGLNGEKYIFDKLPDVVKSQLS